MEEDVREEEEEEKEEEEDEDENWTIPKHTQTNSKLSYKTQTK